MHRQANTKIHRQTHTGRQMHRQRDIQADRQTNRQTDIGRRRNTDGKVEPYRSACHFQKL